MGILSKRMGAPNWQMAGSVTPSWPKHDIIGSYPRAVNQSRQKPISIDTVQTITQAKMQTVVVKRKMEKWTEGTEDL